MFRGGVRFNAHTSAVLPDSTCFSLQTQLHVELAAAVVAVLADLAHDHAWKADYTVKISVSCMRTPAMPGKYDKVHVGVQRNFTSHWTVMSLTSVLPHMQLV